MGLMRRMRRMRAMRSGNHDARAFEPIPNPDDRTTDFDPEEEYPWDPDQQTTDDEWAFEEEDQEELGE